MPACATGDPSVVQAPGSQQANYRGVPDDVAAGQVTGSDAQPQGGSRSIWRRSSGSTGLAVTKTDARVQNASRAGSGSVTKALPA